MHVPSFRTAWTAGALALCVLSLVLLSPASQAQTLLADSIADFSGTQGLNDWNYGYRNLTADGGTRDAYDPVANFIAFTPAQYNGTSMKWDLGGGAPWTEVGARAVHPNGTNNTNEHWGIRRWTAPGTDITGPTLVRVVWFVAADSPGGTGVTAQLHHNGVRLGSTAIAGNNTTGVSTTSFFTIDVGDRIDLALTPVGPGGQTDDGSDGSFTEMTVTTTVDTDTDTMPDSWEELYFPGDLTQLFQGGDKDGDGVTDEAEFAARTNPTLSDTDGDGWSDGDEQLFLSDPLDSGDTPLTLALADSRTQWSGVAGQDGWRSGYRNYTADGGGTNYDAVADFVPFLNDGSNVPETNPVEVNHWNGAAYDFEGNPPWSFLASEGTHPNGLSNGAEHWTIRRWTASGLSGETPVAVIWHTRKANPNNDGVTGSIHVNGAEVDSVTLPGSDTTGFIRFYYLHLNNGDIIDEILSPQGITNRTDGSDGANNWMRIDTRLPDLPVQPNGKFFIPNTATDSDGDGLGDVWEEVYFPGDLTKLAGGADFDGDGLNDEDEMVLGLDPTNADTDGDGCNDGYEVATGTDPCDAASTRYTGAIADSAADWPTAGELNPQGVNGWTHGYYNTTVDGEPPANTNFIPFPTDGTTALSTSNFWNGTFFDWQNAAAPHNPPWTQVSNTGGHPNGDNNVHVHWGVRRWQVNLAAAAPLTLHYNLRKTGSGGNGTTAIVLHNGQQLDSITVAGTDTVGLKSWFFIDAEPGDLLEVALSPRGTNGSDSDAADSSAFGLVVNPTIPTLAFQPDGTPFVSGGPTVDNDGDALSDFWELTHFRNLAQGASDDPNGNGFSNLLDFAHGFDPVTAGALGPLTVDSGGITNLGAPVTDVQFGSGLDFALLYSRRDDYTAHGLVFTVEFSHDLNTWFPATGTGSVVATGPGLEAVRIPYDLFLPNGQKARFWRIVVTKV